MVGPERADKNESPHGLMPVALDLHRSALEAAMALSALESRI